MKKPNINISEILSKSNLKKMTSNVSAEANSLYTGVKGVFQEKNLVHKAQQEGYDQALRKGKKNFEEMTDIAAKTTGKAAANQMNTNLIETLKRSPYYQEIMDYLGGKTKQLSEAARRDLAGAMQAMKDSTGTIPATKTISEHFSDGKKAVEKSAKLKTIPNMAGVYYGKPFKDGADLISKRAIDGNMTKGMKRIGTGVARVGAGVGVVGGGGYAAYSLTRDYRTDLKDNSGSQHY